MTVSKIATPRSTDKMNAAALKKFAGYTFEVVGETKRKPNTDGYKAVMWLKAQKGGATAEKIAEAGNFMQHIAWDFKKAPNVVKGTAPKK